MRSMPLRSSTPCTVRGCRREAVARGLCRTCYKYVFSRRPRLSWAAAKREREEYLNTPPCDRLLASA